jgi:hypothetical protein
MVGDPESAPGADTCGETERKRVRHRQVTAADLLADDEKLDVGRQSPYRRAKRRDASV